jgi:hypothetical protein
MRRVIGRMVVMAVIVALAAGTLPGGALAQGPEDTRARVQAWLKRELGQPGLILVSYTYEGSSWPDASLGCPVEGQSYTPGEISGYAWTFEFSNQVVYEVHSNLDGSQAVLCSARSVAPDVRLTTYQTTVFTIRLPVAWLAFPDDARSEVLFGPQAQPACDAPGARVVVIGRVAAGVTPDQLIDDQLALLDTSDAPAERETVGAFGRTTTAETACKNTTRRWRISTFVQYGTAYRVEQWAPADTFAEWDATFRDMLDRFGPPDAVFSQSATDNGDGDAADPGDTSTAPEMADLGELAPLPMAHVFVGDVFTGPLNAIPGRSVTTVPTLERRYLSFSPDGLYLAFLNATTRQIRTLDAAEGLSPRTIAQRAHPTFPPAWSSDSRRVAYVIEEDATDDGQAVLGVYTVPRTGGEAAQQATFTFPAACPTPLDDPADVTLQRETGAGGVLVWRPDDTFLVSTGCTQGLGLLDPASGKITELGGDLRGGALSPDGTRFLSHTTNGLAVLDFENWQRTNLNVGPDVQQVAWAADGETVYYSTATLADSVTLDDDADQARGEEFFGFWPVMVGVYDVTLMRVDLATNQQGVLWEGQGRGIGRIAPAPDGSGLLFSLVPSSQPVVEVFRAGGDPLAVREAWPEPALYWLPAGSYTPRLLSYSGQPVFAPVAANVG